MKKKLSEQRARTVTKELLSFRGWDLRPVSSGGQLLEESEYLAYPILRQIFENKSKTGSGIGKPDFLLVDSHKSLKPLMVIDTKADVRDLPLSIQDTEHYGNAIHQAGHRVLSVAVAGAERQLCAVRVTRRVGERWKPLTFNNNEIDWIPSPKQTAQILSIDGRTEVVAECPPMEALTEQASRLNEILRECKIKDEYRPIYAATFMLGLWFKDVITDPDVILSQINNNASRVLERAQKPELSQSLRVDEENEELRQRAWQIIDILQKLNIRSFLNEHDYLGQLYETFFRYTGGNTIGQYFTPRHIIDMMCELVNVTPNDIVFDPACGTGGFLIGALRRMIKLQNMQYEDAVMRVHQNIFGIESEPTTAALCIANMILRGDGKSGIIRADCFTAKDYPERLADIALLNPPFPHKRTDTPPTKFLDRALEGIRNKGVLASIVPYSLLVNCEEWHRHILKKNRLLFVATMPPDLFNPYASFNTAVIILQKGVTHEGAKVFFARLSNDGYKLKKNNRVRQEGSQIEVIKQAYDEKRPIAEMTAYRSVTLETKEWSPEAFIESAPHTDDQFIHGFEEHIRQHAAFYVSSGYRLLSGSTKGLAAAPDLFNAHSSLSLSGIKMGMMNVADYFSITLGGKDEIEDLEEGGDTPIVSTSEFDNGITTWKKAKIVYAPDVVTVATDGSTCSSFVQEFPFYAFYKVAILRPKIPDIPIDALYYIAYLLKRERWRYVYARKFGKTRISATVVYCPINNHGNPDFEAMARLTRQCASYPIIASFRGAYSDMEKQAKISKENFS